MISHNNLRKQTVLITFIVLTVAITLFALLIRNQLGHKDLGEAVDNLNATYGQIVRNDKKLLVTNFQTGEIFTIPRGSEKVELVVGGGRSILGLDLDSESNLYVVSKHAASRQSLVLDIRDSAYKLKASRSIDLSPVNALTLQANPKILVIQDSVFINGNVLIPLNNYDENVSKLINAVSDDNIATASEFVFEGYYLKNGQCYEVDRADGTYNFDIIDCHDKRPAYKVSFDASGLETDLSWNPWQVKILDRRDVIVLVLAQRSRSTSPEMQQILYVYDSGEQIQSTEQVSLLVDAAIDSDGRIVKLLKEGQMLKVDISSTTSR